MKRVALWLDDQRDPFRSTWSELAQARAQGGEIRWVSSCEAFIDAYTELFTHDDEQLVSVMLDYDLSTTDTNGDDGEDAANALVEDAITFDVEPFALSTHTSSTHGEQAITRVFQKLLDHWAAE